MKIEQQDQAKELFFQTNMSKTDIAQKVGVARKTVLFWAQQGNWDKLRRSARSMPSAIAEKCYYLIDQYMNSLLRDANVIGNSTIDVRNAQTIHLLATSIKKLKNRSTVNESMEMFNFFLDGLNRRDPQLAAQVAPQIEDFISIRNNSDTTDFLMEEFSDNGRLPFPEKEILELQEDEKQIVELNRDFETFITTREAAPPQEAPPAATVPLKETTPAQPKTPSARPDVDLMLAQILAKKRAQDDKGEAGALHVAA